MTQDIDFQTPFMLDDVHVEPMLNRISRGPAAAHLERQVMLLLVHLARHAGEPLTREALYAAVWSHGEPNDEALTQAISKLRKALAEISADKRMVETIRKVGYRLTVAPCAVTPAQPDPSTAHPARRRPIRKAAFWASSIALILIALGSQVSIQTTHLDGDRDVRVVRIKLHSDRSSRDAEWVAEDVANDLVSTLPENARGAVAFVHRPSTSD